jgi:hypothetical protein
MLADVATPVSDSCALTVVAAPAGEKASIVAAATERPASPTSQRNRGRLLGAVW